MRGLANKASGMLATVDSDARTRQRGGQYTGKVRITAGASAVDAAYSVARFFPGARVRLSDATDSSVRSNSHLPTTGR